MWDDEAGLGDHELELEIVGKARHILRCVLCGKVFGERELPQSDCPGAPPALGVHVADGVAVKDEVR